MELPLCKPDSQCKMQSGHICGVSAQENAHSAMANPGPSTAERRRISLLSIGATPEFPCKPNPFWA